MHNLGTVKGYWFSKQILNLCLYSSRTIEKTPSSCAKLSVRARLKGNKNKIASIVMHFYHPAVSPSGNTEYSFSPKHHKESIAELKTFQETVTYTIRDSNDFLLREEREDVGLGAIWG